MQEERSRATDLGWKKFSCRTCYVLLSQRTTADCRNIPTITRNHLSPHPPSSSSRTTSTSDCSLSTVSDPLTGGDGVNARLPRATQSVPRTVVSLSPRCDVRDIVSTCRPSSHPLYTQWRVSLSNWEPWYFGEPCFTSVTTQPRPRRQYCEIMKFTSLDGFRVTVVLLNRVVVIDN